MQTPHTPDSSKRPSSVVRGGAPLSDSSPPRPLATDNPPSAIAGVLPQRDPTDDAPTIISMNRPHAAGEGLQGRKLGHFELIEPLGAGGMAAVIRATDLQLGRVVALKVLPPEMAADPENIVRFKNEARAAAKLDHENIARVYFCGEDQGLHFIAFEFVAGEELEGDEVQPLVFAAEVDARDVLVVELGGGTGLVLEADDVFGIGRHLRRQHLQGDDAAELQIGGANHRGHAACAERFNQFEVAKLPAL